MLELRSSLGATSYEVRKFKSDVGNLPGRASGPVKIKVRRYLPPGNVRLILPR